MRIAGGIIDLKSAETNAHALISPNLAGSDARVDRHRLFRAEGPLHDPDEEGDQILVLEIKIHRIASVRPAGWTQQGGRPMVRKRGYIARRVCVVPDTDIGPRRTRLAIPEVGCSTFRAGDENPGLARTPVSAVRGTGSLSTH